MKVEDLKSLGSGTSKTLACPVPEQTHLIMNAIASRKGVTVAYILKRLVGEFLEENKGFVDSIPVSAESPKTLPQIENSLPTGL